VPIVLFRLDERLIHGQVVVGWGERMNFDRFIVVDDELSESSWEQELYCLGVPSSADALFVNVPTARASLPDWQEDPRRLVVLVRNVETLARLAEDDMLQGMEINLGGVHHAPGRTRLLPYLFLSSPEMDALRKIEESGCRVATRDLPSARSVPLSELLSDA
jgi:mannose/fructose/N-acetylgalactosamine-specific phosphotransferase system component IIB